MDLKEGLTVIVCVEVQGLTVGVCGSEGRFNYRCVEVSRGYLGK